MAQEITFRFGFLAPRFEEQANEQGYTLGDYAEFADRVMNAYLIMKMNYLTDKQEESVRNKIGKDLTKHLKPLEEVENDKQGDNQ